MNATSHQPPVLNRMHNLSHSLSHNVRTRTRASLDRLAHANLLRITTQEFYACESGVRKARALLTQVVAEKVRLRSYLGTGSQNALSDARQQYDALHAYEQRLLSYLKQAGLTLPACLASLNALKAEPYAAQADQELRISALRTRLQATGAEQGELAAELIALLPHDGQPEVPENTGESPARATINYKRIVLRLRQWMPVH